MELCFRLSASRLRCVTLASRAVGNGCEPVSGTKDLYPLTEVADLATEFTPPFHIVTAKSQTAAVPIQFGWLLGGILLGLGIKAVARRR